MPKAYIVMGVSGSGKSTVAEMLAEKLDCAYVDADNFHPEANVKKMSSGQPLNDDDRQPWLERLYQLIEETINEGKSLTLACSALKQSYRDILKGNLENVIVVYLEGGFELILERMNSRKGHFMKAGMLRSQFDELEPPPSAITVSISNPPEKIIESIIENINNY